MRGAPLLATLLLAAPLAAALLPPAALAQGNPLPAQPHVVIAVLDSGINPYHAEFLDPGRDAHPATYVDGYPAAAARLDLCLDARAFPGCGTMPGAWARDQAAWEGVTNMSRDAAGWDPSRLRWIPGTRIIGAASFGPKGDPWIGAHHVFDDEPGTHGTAVASLAAGTTLGRCPRCLLVVVEGPSTDALRWVRDQPWIDVVTNSWGLAANLGWPPPPVGAAFSLDAQATRAMVERGKTVLFAAGNGPGLDTVPGLTTLPEYLVPGETTYTSEYAGPDWVLTVGAVDPANDQPVAGIGRPVDVSADGLNVRAADGLGRSLYRAGFGGTSAATPIAAGVAGHVLLRLRETLGDPREGPRDGGILAQGLPPASAAPGTPLADGVLTRAELQRLVLATARPCLASAAWTAEVAAVPPGACPAELWPFPFGVYGWTLPTAPAAYPPVQGYGTVDWDTRDAALAAALGSGPPPRPYADCWAGVDSVLRQRLWGTWAGGAKIAGLGCHDRVASWPGADLTS